MNRMWTATRQQLSPIQLMISIGLCFALNLAAKQLNDPGSVVPKTPFKPQPLSTNNNFTLTEDALKSHDVPKQYTAANSNSGEEARGIKEIFDRLGSLINKLQGEGTSSLTEPLLQTDANIANGDKKLVKHLQTLTERTEAQETFLIATINRFRESEDFSDQTFGDFELINLLTNPKLAEAIFDNWFNENETPLTVIKRLDRTFPGRSPESTLRKFFEHRAALPWLSYVGYCWKYKKGDFTAEELFQFFKKARLEAEFMAELLYNARQFPFGLLVFDRMQQYSVISPSTRSLAFYLEMMVSEINEISNFWDMLILLKPNESPLNIWLEYIAFRYPHVMELEKFIFTDVAVAGFLKAKEMSVENREKMFQQIFDDMNNKKVFSTLYAPNLVLQPFAKSRNPHEFLQRDKNLKNLAKVMARCS